MFRHCESIGFSKTSLDHTFIEARCADSLAIVRPWLGATHCSDIPLVFGTYGDFRGGETPFQRSVSEKMQDLWLAFAGNPQQGLQELDWPALSTGLDYVAGQAIVFARDEKVVQMEDVSIIDANYAAS